jgi:hypothetical protein
MLVARCRILMAAVVMAAASALGATPSHGKKSAPPPPPVGPVTGNPLLPPAIPVEQFFFDLSLVAKAPAATPGGFEPVYSAEDWAGYRERFGAEADGLNKLKSSGLIGFSNKLIAASEEPGASGGFQRLLLLRAAIDCYRTRDGFTTANKAVTAYEKIFDIHSAMQVGALWSIANAMSRSITTPRPDRIHYSAIAARANMQLTLILLDHDQLAAAQALVKMVAYHEGWVHTSGATPADKMVHGQIAQVRALVRQTTATLDYLATQYEPAINGDDQALMAIYLYGRYVKNKPEIVADLPGRKPSSPLAQLAASLAAANRDPEAMYTAAETLKVVASTLPDGVLKQRTLYAALQNYRGFIAAPQTERDRVKRTLARMATESVIADGARGPAALLNPFASVVASTQEAPEPAATVEEEKSPPATERAAPTTAPATAPLPSIPNMPEPAR